MLIVLGALVARLAIGSELGGVQALVAQVFECATVELGGSGLSGGDDLAARGRAVLRLVSRSEHPELADHVWRHAEIRECHHAALRHRAFLHADAVHNGFVTRGKPTVYAGIEGAVATACADAGKQDSELRGVSGSARHH